MKIWMNTVPTWQHKFWKESLPVGNGKTSALLTGSVGTERLMINHFSRWEGESKTEVPDVSSAFLRMRETIESGNYSGGRDMLCDALHEHGYTHGLDKLATPCAPLEIVMYFEIKHPHKHYKRGIDLDNGEAFVNYRSGNDEIVRTAFVSFHDDAVIMRVRSTSDLSVRIVVPEGLNFNIIPAKDGRLSENCGELILKDTNEFTIISGFGKLPEENNYDKLLERSIPLYKEALGDASLTLYKDSDQPNEHLLEEAEQNGITPELVEKMWLFGRYLFASGTAEGGTPFALYGLWNGEANLIYAQNVANENVQAIYWHAAVGGFFSQIRELIHYYYNMMPNCRKAAKNLFGCRGIFVSVYSSPLDSLPAPDCPVIINYISAAGWLCRHFYEYYRFTHDESLLNIEILPLMLETAQFYEDYLFYDADGKLTVSPSVSPENTPLNLIPEEAVQKHLEMHFNVAVRNSTMDFAIIKDLLSGLVELSKTHEIAETRVESWKKILSDIPEYRINSDGAVAEWMDENLSDHYFHRHLSHLYPLFPGDEIRRGDKCFSAFERAVDLREMGGMCGWSFVHMACVYARLGRGDDALLCIENAARYTTLKNLFTLGTDWRENGGTTSGCGDDATIQLDAALGAVGAIQEMLLSVYDDELRFLPACPDLLDKGTVKHWRFPGGKVSFSWNRKTEEFSFELLPERDTAILLHFPVWTNSSDCAVSLSAGQKYSRKLQ